MMFFLEISLTDRIIGVHKHQTRKTNCVMLGKWFAVCWIWISFLKNSRACMHVNIFLFFHTMWPTPLLASPMCSEQRSFISISSVRSRFCANVGVLKAAFSPFITETELNLFNKHKDVILLLYDLKN